MSDAAEPLPNADPAPLAPPPAKAPWELHPALTADRLQTCARMLANARRDAIAMASEELGDDAWSVGCRAYAFSRHRLRRTAEAGHYPWLKILDESHLFVFLIDEVPVRFYRGAADEPTNRTLRRQQVEAEQLSLALGEDAERDSLLFRFAIETGERGRVERVVFLALRDEERIECFWPVPLEVSAMPAAHGGPVQLRLIGEEPPPARNDTGQPAPRLRRSR